MKCAHQVDVDHPPPLIEPEFSTRCTAVNTPALLHSTFAAPYGFSACFASS